AVLRKQEKRPGFGRNLDDHQRWPNTFFAEHGLFTLTTAHYHARHSRSGTQRLESRVRENRTHGSEGGEATSLPYPYRLNASTMFAKKGRGWPGQARPRG